SCLTILFRPVSKSTKVSEGHTALRSSSRVTSWPGRSSSVSRTTKHCSGILIRRPSRRSSWERGSSWNESNRYMGGRTATVDCPGFYHSSHKVTYFERNSSPVGSERMVLGNGQGLWLA